MIKKLILFVFVVTILGYNCWWGLPSQTRLELIGGESALNTHLNGILEVRKKSLANHDSDFSSLEQLYMGAREFLIRPWNGGADYTTGAIASMNPSELDFDPHYYMYGGGMIYPAAAALQFAAWLKVFPLVREEVYYFFNPEIVGRICLVLRWFIVFGSALGICLSYSLARQYWTKAIAYLALFILLALPLTHQSSRTIEPHLYTVFLYILAFGYTLKYALTKQLKHLILLSLFTGFVIGTQSTSFSIVCAFCTALFWRSDQKQFIKEKLKHIIIYIGTSIAALLALNPYFILNFNGLMKDFNRGMGNQLFTHNSLKDWAPSQMSWCLLVLLVCAILYHVFRYRKNIFSVLALSCVVPAVFIYVLLANFHMPYVFSPLVLGMILVAVMLRDWIVNAKGLFKWASISIIAISFLISPIGRSVYYVRNFTAYNREAAGKWINNNIPKGSSLGIRLPLGVWDSVPFKLFDYELVDRRDLDQSNREDWPEYIFLMDSRLNKALIPHYESIKNYTPRTVLGRHYKMVGELKALIAKRIDIYKLKA